MGMQSGTKTVWGHEITRASLSPLTEEFSGVFYLVWGSIGILHSGEDRNAVIFGQLFAEVPRVDL
jgi:hypothetical protein